MCLLDDMHRDGCHPNVVICNTLLLACAQGKSPAQNCEAPARRLTSGSWLCACLMTCTETAVAPMQSPTMPCSRPVPKVRALPNNLKRLREGWPVADGRAPG